MAGGAAMGHDWDELVSWLDTMLPLVLGVPTASAVGVGACPHQPLEGGMPTRGVTRGAWEHEAVGHMPFYCMTTAYLCYSWTSSETGRSWRVNGICGRVVPAGASLAGASRHRPTQR